jgi:hypothetical protein
MKATLFDTTDLEVMVRDEDLRRLEGGPVTCQISNRHGHDTGKDLVLLYDPKSDNYLKMASEQPISLVNRSMLVLGKSAYHQLQQYGIDQIMGVCGQNNHVTIYAPARDTE